MTTDTPNRRAGMAEKCLPWFREEFEKLLTPGNGLRTAFVERIVAPEHSVGPDGNATPLKRVLVKTKLKYDHLQEASVREAASELALAAVGRLDKKLAKALQHSMDTGATSDVHPSWFEAIEHATAAIDGHYPKAVAVHKDDYQKLARLTGAELGATSDHDKKLRWPELLKAWTGSTPVSSESAITTLMLGVKTWKATLYIGQDWKLYCDPLPTKLEFSAEILALPLVEKGAAVAVNPPP